jgi:hypothetical protein
LDCPDLTTSATLEEAKAILEPYFIVAQERFVEARFTRVRRTSFKVTGRMHDSARHFAGTREDGLVVEVAPEMVEIGEEFVIAIMAHELGHATDFLYPGEFVLGHDEELVRRRRPGLVTDEVEDDPEAKQWKRWHRMWLKRDAYVVEKTADRIAEFVYEKPIGYTGPCLLETFEGGVPRPTELR